MAPEEAGQPLSSRDFRFGEWIAKPRLNRLSRGEESVQVEPKLMELLVFLAQRPRQVVSKGEIFDAVWATRFIGDSVLTRAIAELRRLLGDDARHPRFIETIPKKGYRFIAAARSLDEGPLSRVSPRAAASSRQATLAGHSSTATARRLRGSLLVLGIVGLTALGLYLFRSARRTPVASTLDSIAVLPLANLGPPDEEYFADGMTDALITQLAKVRALKVISRTSVWRFKAAEQPLPEIAAELAVRAIVVGSVHRAGDRVRISAQLIDASTDRHLWADNYDRDLEDILALQSEVAQTIVREIRVQVAPEEEARLSNLKKVDPQAHQTYLRALSTFYRAQAGDRRFFENMTTTIELLREALEQDPSFVQARAQLAHAYQWLASASDIETAARLYRQSKEAALRAIELDEDNAEAYEALAEVLLRLEWDFAGAETAIRRSLEIDANSGHWTYARLLMALGRWDEAIDRYQLARERRPGNRYLEVTVAWALICAGRIDEARGIAENLRATEDGRAFGAWVMGEILLREDDYERAVVELESAFEALGEDAGSGLGVPLAYAYAKSGRLDDARSRLRTLEQLGEGILADVYLALGDEERALSHLAEALDARRGLVYVRCSEELDYLQTLPRFQQILDAVGFPR